MPEFIDLLQKVHPHEYHSKFIPAFLLFSWQIEASDLDLLLFRDGNRLGFEFKCSDAPTLTKSMHVALTDLGLHKLFIVYPGKDRYPLHEKIEALPLRDCAHLLEPGNAPRR